jgi:hypothetical protein
MSKSFGVLKEKSDHGTEAIFRDARGRPGQSAEGCPPPTATDIERRTDSRKRMDLRHA